MSASATPANSASDGSNGELAAIARFLTPEQPFGPPESDLLFTPSGRRAEVLFDRSNLIFAHAEATRPTYVVGRKGAGKTAFLFGSTLASRWEHEALRTPAIYSRYLATVKRFEALHATLFADQLAEVWDALLYHVAAFHLWRTATNKDRLEELQVIWDYVPPADPADSTAFAERFLADLREAAEDARSGADLGELINTISFGGRAFRDVRAAVRILLARRQPNRLVIVMDNLEDLHLDLEVVAPALRGLFRCIGQHEAAGSTTDFDLRVCLPSEPYDQIRLLSVNPSKDFRRALTIYWSSQELLHLAGARLRMFLASHHREELEGLSARAADQHDGEDDVSLLRAALPLTMTNGLGITEDPIAYVLRHTQLIPRHLIEVLNAVFTARPGQQSRPWAVTEQAVLSGTRSAEQVIVLSILSAYGGTKSTVPWAVRALANRLPIRFSVSEAAQGLQPGGRQERHQASSSTSSSPCSSPWEQLASTRTRPAGTTAASSSTPSARRSARSRTPTSWSPTRYSPATCTSSPYARCGAGAR